LEELKFKFGEKYVFDQVTELMKEVEIFQQPSNIGLSLVNGKLVISPQQIQRYTISKVESRPKSALKPSI
jgi:hypothetical protein